MINRLLVRRMRSSKTLAPILRALLAVLLTFGAYVPARSQNVGAIPGYVHRTWTALDGAPQNISALAQGRDGQLWIGSGLGLSRFDGLNFEQIARIPGDKSRSVDVSALLVSGNGDVWVGYDYGGLAIFRNGKLQDANHGPPHGRVGHIIEAVDGSIYVSTYGLKKRDFWRFSHGRWTELEDRWGVPDAPIQDLVAASDGSVWIVAGSRVLVLNPGSRRFQSVAPVAEDAMIAEDRAGTIWASIRDKFTKIATVAPDAKAAGPWSHGSSYMVTDDKNRLFGKSGAGLYSATSDGRGHSSVPTSFTQSFGLTSNTVETLFLDREGDIWVGTAVGLDRFKPSVLQPTAGPWRLDLALSSVMVKDWRGRIYLADNAALFRVDGKESGYRTMPLQYDPMRIACRTPDGDILVTEKFTLKSLRTGHITKVVFPGTEAETGIAFCAVDGQGRILAKIRRIGLLRLENGVWRKLALHAHGEDLNAWIFSTDLQGRLLLNLALQGFARLDGDKVEWIGSREDIGVGLIKVTHPLPDAVLLGGELGLARYRKGHIQTLSSQTYPWLGSVTGIAQLPSGETWLLTAAGLVHLPTSKLEAAFERPGVSLKPKIYGFADGFPGAPQLYGVDDLLVDGTGRIWIITTGGIASLDPNQIAPNRLPPPVEIRSVVAGKSRYENPAQLTLPQGTTDLAIRFAVLGLRSPEELEVRYRLEGHGDWVDPGERRQAFYTNLAPGIYRFQVIAANEDGVWNRQGATLTFVIEPTLTQTWAFRVACGLVVLLAAWSFYSLRLRQIARQERWRAEERLRERWRIARDLHDTLLQAVQGLILRFQSAFDKMPDNTPAKASLERTLLAADRVLDEAREKVTELRAPRASAPLAEHLMAVAGQIFDETSVQYKLDIDGAERTLDATVGEEMVRIAREALLNAQRHANASGIVIGLRYGLRSFQLRIQDNGSGIDPAVLARGGREGHFGLTGMRERAETIEATIGISNLAPGTEILVNVSARRAYARKALDSPHEP